MPARTVFEHIKIDYEKEQQEAARRNALGYSDQALYCTKRECLVKLVKLESESDEDKKHPVYQCSSCKEKIEINSSNRIQWLRDYREIKQLRLARDEYISDAKEIRAKLQFLKQWERLNKT